MAEQRNELNQMDSLRTDINSLKESIVELSRRVNEQGGARARELSESAKARIHKLNDSGRAQVERVEEQIREKPGQSIALAFAAGLLASAVLSRRH